MKIKVKDREIIAGKLFDIGVYDLDKLCFKISKEDLEKRVKKSKAEIIIDEPVIKKEPVKKEPPKKVEPKKVEPKEVVTPKATAEG